MEHETMKVENKVFMIDANKSKWQLLSRCRMHRVPFPTEKVGVFRGQETFLQARGSSCLVWNVWGRGGKARRFTAFCHRRTLLSSSLQG
jgi:hypothetical protein